MVNIVHLESLDIGRSLSTEPSTNLTELLPDQSCCSPVTGFFSKSGLDGKIPGNEHEAHTADHMRTFGAVRLFSSLGCSKSVSGETVMFKICRFYCRPP